MAEPSATEMNASERDALFALAALMESVDSPPTLAQWRNRAAEMSARFSKAHPSFYTTRDKLVERGFITQAPHPADARTKSVGLTLSGEEALNELAERSAKSARRLSDV